jgi:spermidine/putrescine transport system substrate-binding protein
MISQHPEVIAAIAGTMRSSMSRRRLLGAAGLTGAALVASACGASDEALSNGNAGAAGGLPQNEAPDLSAQDKTANWSNWPLYIDIDDATGTRPSLDEFQKLSGINVTYTEDVNDNNEFYAKVRTQLDRQRIRREARQRADP